MRRKLIERCGELDGAIIGDGAFARSPAIWVGKREVAHFDADGALDVRLTRRDTQPPIRAQGGRQGLVPCGRRSV